MAKRTRYKKQESQKQRKARRAAAMAEREAFLQKRRSFDTFEIHPLLYLASVMVNTPKYGAVARFGKNRMDIHNAENTACVDCSSDASWEVFCAGVREVHDIEIPASFRPLWSKLLHCSSAVEKGTVIHQALEDHFSKQDSNG